MLKPITHPLLKNIKHGFFTRKGGVSSGLYSSLNVGTGSNDEPQNIKQNRKMVAEFFNTERIYSCFQIHSNKVFIIDNHDKLWAEKNAPEYDGIVCNISGIPIGSLSADCGTVLFADIENNIIGCCHCGWRGAKDNIMKNVVDEMVNLSAIKKNIVAVVGAVITQDNYEVGDEFYNEFINEAQTNDKYFIKKDKYHFDLNSFIVDKLNDLEIGAVGSLYETEKTDTYSDEERFFSFRRTTHKKESDYGRNISIICL